MPATFRRLLALLVVAAVLLTACSAPGGEDTSPGGGTTGDSAGETDTGTETPQRYAALGDSYSAAPLVPTTDVADGCFRSSANYPALVAGTLGAELTDVTCGGAATSDVDRSQRPGIPPQRSALGPDTDLVTVGLGGNDAEVFSMLVERCSALGRQDPSGSPCQQAMATTGGGDRLLDALGDTQRRLTRVLRQVGQRAPDAQVLAVGYPRIVDADSTCPRLPLAAGDYPYAERVNRALTEVVRAAAAASGATYVDVWRASRGHDICSEDPWVNGAVTDQRRAAAYHPFAEEQQAVADLVLAAVGD